MSSFDLDKRIKPCYVTRELVANLEDYLLQHIADITGISSEELVNYYSLAVTDDLGTEILRSVKDFRTTLFLNSTSKISISLNVIWVHKINLRLSIKFQKKDPEFSSVSIDYTGSNARETIVGLYDGIRRVISPSTNSNWLFHPSMPIKFVLLGILPSPLFAAFSLYINHYDLPATLCLLVFLILGFYLASGQWLRLYIVFDSRNAQSKDKLSNLLFYGILSLIIFSTISTIFGLLRRQWLGF